jgi:hypothetical protein
MACYASLVRYANPSLARAGNRQAIEGSLGTSDFIPKEMKP